MTIIESLADWVRSAPDDTFGWIWSAGDWRRQSCGDVDDRVSRYVAAFRRRRIAPGSVVLIFCREPADSIAGFLGAMAAGLIPSLMPRLTPKQHPDLYWQAHLSLFDLIRPGALVLDEDLPASVTRAGMTTVPIITTGDAAREPGDRLWHAARPDEVALLQHTSGTTGLKKGIALTHRAVLAQTERYARALDALPGQRIASWLPLYHDMGLVACFLMPLTRRMPVATMAPLDWLVRPAALLEIMEHLACRFAWLPNFAFHHLANQTTGGPLSLASVGAFINCSEPCRPAAFDQFLAAFAGSGVTAEQLQVCYAMAETVFAVSQTGLGKPVTRLAVDASPTAGGSGRVRPVAPESGGTVLLSSGRPLPGVAFAVVGADADAEPCTVPGSIGEILLRSDFLFDGYYGRPEATAAKFLGPWYRTGDLGFCWNDEMFVIGRLDDVLIVNGRKVPAPEVEAVVGGVTGVKPGRATVFTVQNDALGTGRLVCVAETGTDPGGHAALRRTIKERVLSETDTYLNEVRLVGPGWLVKTTSGKIDRGANRRKYLSEGSIDG